MTIVTATARETTTTLTQTVRSAPLRGDGRLDRRLSVCHASTLVLRQFDCVRVTEPAGRQGSHALLYKQ